MRFSEMPIAHQMQLQYEVEQFLFAEAELLDSRRYEQWLDCIADDIHYWMPIRRTVQAKEIDQEFTAPGAMAFFDDDKQVLSMRVQRMLVGRAWAEDPPSRSRRLITNVVITECDSATDNEFRSQQQEIQVRCNFQLYRTRLNSEEDCWIGRREDRLRRIAAKPAQEPGQGPGSEPQSADKPLLGFELVRRHIFLEQTVILAQNMSTLF